MGRSSGSFLTNKAIAKKILRPSIQLTDKEKDFRVKLYTDVSKIKNENLKCSICLRNIETAIFGKGRFFRHIVLDVLMCEVCLDFYGDGDFSTDEDGDEKYCRWCGQGGKLYFCSKCTCAFCKKCVRQNLGRSEVEKLEHKDWNCFICRPKPLFPLRAECWAVQEYLQNEKMGRSSGSFLIKKANAKKILRPSIQLTDKEKDFRVKLYTDVSEIKNENLKCTICLRNIATAIFGKGRFFRHIVLDVLMCEVCLDFYGDGDFSADEDGDEKYCRWCGQGGKLYFCSKCICAFCKKCVRQNLGRSEVEKLEHKDWNCFICRPKPLFPLRAECWAVQEYLQNENCRVKKASSRQKSSKRKHPSISEILPKQTKMENQSPATKKSKLRDTPSSHEDRSRSYKDKPKPHLLKYSDCIGLIRALEVILKNCSKSEKAENPSGCINGSKSPKRKRSPGHTKQIINRDSTENHIYSKKSTSVNSNNNSCKSKVFEDVKLKKKDKYVDLVDSGKSSKTNHSADSSVICSESKKIKNQILACDFLLSTNQNVGDLGTLMMDRMKLYEQMITPNSLKTLDDVFKTKQKLSKMLVCVNKNVSILQTTLEQYMKSWTAFMELSNTENLNLFIFSKSEVKNKAKRMGICELVEGVEANSENIKSIVNKDDRVRAVKSEKPEFPSGSDIEQVTDDDIQSVTKSTENKKGTETTDTKPQVSGKNCK